MKIIAILLILVGIAGISCSFIAFGDIGIACGLSGVGAMLSGFGFLITAKKINRLKEQ